VSNLEAGRGFRYAQREEGAPCPLSFTELVEWKRRERAIESKEGVGGEGEGDPEAALRLSGRGKTGESELGEPIFSILCNKRPLPPLWGGGRREREKGK